MSTQTPKNQDSDAVANSSNSGKTTPNTIPSIPLALPNIPEVTVQIAQAAYNKGLNEIDPENKYPRARFYIIDQEIWISNNDSSELFAVVTKQTTSSTLQPKAVEVTLPDSNTTLILKKKTLTDPLVTEHTKDRQNNNIVNEDLWTSSGFDFFMSLQPAAPSSQRDFFTFCRSIQLSLTIKSIKEISSKTELLNLMTDFLDFYSDNPQLKAMIIGLYAAAGVNLQKRKVKSQSNFDLRVNCEFTYTSSLCAVVEFSSNNNALKTINAHKHRPYSRCFGIGKDWIEIVYQLIMEPTKRYGRPFSSLFPHSIDSPLSFKNLYSMFLLNVNIDPDTGHIIFL